MSKGQRFVMLVQTWLLTAASAVDHNPLSRARYSVRTLNKAACIPEESLPDDLVKACEEFCEYENDFRLASQGKRTVMSKGQRFVMLVQTWLLTARSAVDHDPLFRARYLVRTLNKAACIPEESLPDDLVKACEEFCEYENDFRLASQGKKRNVVKPSWVQ